MQMNSTNQIQNNKNGTRIIYYAISILAVIMGLFHTVFIRPLESQLGELKADMKERTQDRWTKQDAIRAHDKLEEMIKSCCSR